MRVLFRLSKIQRKCKLMAASLSTSAKASAKVYLQVLGTETRDTTPSLFLFADSQRYLFNCGEGTQRIFNEHKLRLTRVNNIFFTRICWEYIGGLPGVTMTLRDNGKSDIGLNGPSNLPHFIHATRFFLYHEKLKFDCVGFTGREGEKYEDENLTIWPVLLNEKREGTGITSWSGKTHTEGTMKSTDDSSSSSDESEQPSIKKWKLDSNESTSVCYICQLASLPGKFFPNKAIELGVPKGPSFADLVSGKTVTLEDGRQVTPEEVTGPCQLGPVFIIVDCPTPMFISSLVSNEHLRQYWEEGPCVTPAVIVHLTPMNIFQSEEYEEWRKRFGDKVSHLLINKDVCATPIVFQSQATVQCKLHSIDPEIFPLLETTDIPEVRQDQLPKNCFPGENLLKFHLRPIKQEGFDRTDLLQKLDCDSIIKETQTLLAGKLNQLGATGFEQRSHDKTELASSASSARSLSTSSSSGSRDLIRSPRRDPFSRFPNPTIEILEAVGVRFLDTEEHGYTVHEITAMKARQGIHKDYEVVFLGTGASIPSKYRNVSSTLINMSEKGSILLDCGEGTYGQLYRHYGKYVDRVLFQLKCVFISHIHADHHLGLIRILEKRFNLENEAPEDYLLIIGPAKIGKWLQEYDSWCEDIHYRFVDSMELVVQRDGDYWDVNSHLDAKEVLTVPVDHCAEAYGLVLKHQRGWKIVYSGDTRPCQALIEAGKDADLLIHEATLEDELKAEALAKKHSTTTEAIESGVKMDAKFIMLNHFSQRYPKIPVFSEQFTSHIGIAFDHMKIHSSNLSKIPRLLEPLKTVFAEEIDEMSKTK
ncbi:zinc phosphodiesterase ELAC protein 2-like [Oculina patagonica]